MERINKVYLPIRTTNINSKIISNIPYQIPDLNFSFTSLSFQELIIYFNTLLVKNMVFDYFWYFLLQRDYFEIIINHKQKIRIEISGKTYEFW